MTDTPTDRETVERLAKLFENGHSGGDFAKCAYTLRALVDRAEAVEAELHLMKTSGIVEVAVRNPSVSEYMAHWEKRAETAEAERDAAVLAAYKDAADIARRTVECCQSCASVEDDIRARLSGRWGAKQ